MLTSRRRAAVGGFTLIELMVTIAVLAILLMAAMPALGTWVADSRIRSVAESLQNGLRRAEGAALETNRRSAFALTNAKPALTARPSKNGSNWYVRVLLLDDSDESDDASKDADAASRFLGGSKSGAQSGVHIEGPALLCFNPLGRQTSLTADETGLEVACDTDNPVVYTVSSTSTRGSRTLKVTVDLGGRVRMCDPAKTLSDENPDGC